MTSCAGRPGAALAEADGLALVELDAAKQVFQQRVGRHGLYDVEDADRDTLEQALHAERLPYDQSTTAADITTATLVDQEARTVAVQALPGPAGGQLLVGRDQVDVVSP